MRAPFFLLAGTIVAYGLSQDLPNLDSVLALYRQPEGRVSGAEVFRKCAICHSLEPGVHRIGPSLHCVVGRRIAALPDFRYSTGMRSARLDSAFGPYEPETWTRETLTAYVLNPTLTFNNTRMPFPGFMVTEADEDLLDVTTALIDHLEANCSEERHELVALQPRGTDAEALTCITIARESSLPACQEMAASLRGGDNRDDPSLPTLACIPPGKLVCGSGTGND